MRTGTEGNRTVTFCLEKTVWCWCGTTTAAGAMCRATITSPTPAKKAPVSDLTLNTELEVTISAVLNALVRNNTL